MVRVTMPMMSMKASGSIGKAVTFASWKGRDYARRLAIPANPNSGLQVGIRSVFKFITQNYKNLLPADLSDWEALATTNDVTPLNAQVADACGRARRNLGWRENTTDADPAQIDAVTGAAAVAQPRTLVLGWTAPVANQPDSCYAIYRSTVTGFTPDISNLVAVVEKDVLSYTDVGLTAGVPYYYRIRGLSKSGFLGTLVTEFTGTPTT